MVLRDPHKTPSSEAEGGGPTTARVIAFLAALATVLLAFPAAITMSRGVVLPGWYRVGSVVVALPYFAVLGGIFFVRPRLAGMLAMTAGAVGSALIGFDLLAASWRIGPLGVIAAYLLISPVQGIGVPFAQFQLLWGGHALWNARALPLWRQATIGLAAVAAFAGLLAFESARQAWTVRHSLAATNDIFTLSPKQSARGDLYETLPCLARYANDHGEYPESLDAVGPRGSKCLPEVVIKPIPGYVTSYEPHRSSENGPRDVFALRYEPVNKAERADAFFQADETGLVYSGVDANGRPQYPIQNDTGTLDYMTAGVEYFRLLAGTYSYPSTLQESAAARSIDLFKQFNLAPERDDPKRAGRLEGYRFQYTPGPVDATGHILTYRFDARPVVYGRDYKRSYMCESTGHFHATDEDRAAEPTDPNPRFDAALKEDLPGPCHTFEQVRFEHAKYLATQKERVK